MNEDLKCPICGEPTVVYYGRANKNGLCIKHARQANAGEIIQCQACGKWNEKDVICECKKNEEKSQKWIKVESPWTKKQNNELCIICGEPSHEKNFCPNCYKDIKIFYKDITHLNDIHHAKEYYYNLKNSIFWINKIDYAKKACKKLYAVAQIIDEFKNINQKQIAIKDIKYLLNKKTEYLKDKEIETPEPIIENDDFQDISEEIADYRRMYPATIRCKDGHYVRSNNEKTIDDRLYEKRIFHEYETRYKAKDGQSYYPDFYLPDANVFIEYFGVSENQEKNNKKRKLFLQDNDYKFEFIEHTKAGILDEVVYDIIDKYNLNNKKNTLV